MATFTYGAFELIVCVPFNEVHHFAYDDCTSLVLFYCIQIISVQYE